MRYYTIQNNNLLTAETEQALTRYYDKVYPLPDDYEQGKYIIGETEKEITVIDYDEEGNPTGEHTEIIKKQELVLNEHFEEEQAQKEKERIAKLSLTKREVFLALYRAKQITPDMIKAQIGSNAEALIEFEYANDYYRGNPLIDTIGGMLGYTSDDLDYLFEHKEFPEKEEAEEE